MLTKTIIDKLNDKVCAIDFDGTITRTKDINKIEGLQKGVIKALNRLRKAGFYILIYSCRNNTSPVHLEPDQKNQQQVMQDMIDFLNANNIPYDGIDMGRNGKPFAKYYIDDKGIRYNNNWEEIVDFILEKDQE